MPARALAALTVLLAVFVAGTSSAKEPKAPASPAEIIEYHDSGQWKADTTRQVKRARAFVRKWLTNHDRPYKRKPAIVLDIDDTSLSLYECGRERDFEAVSIVCPVAPKLPAIRQVRSFFRYARKQKVAVFFITGRPEALGDFSRKQLKSAGYGGRWKLYLQPADYHEPSRVPFKSGVRRRITKRGFRILANLGDQRSDLKGGYALRAYKLPNPMYFTP